MYRNVLDLWCFILYLVIMEDDVSILVFSRNRVRPQLLHKEHLIRELWGNTCKKNTKNVRKIVYTRDVTATLSDIQRWFHTFTNGACFLDPVSQMTNKIEEKVAFRYTDHCKNIANALNFSAELLHFSKILMEVSRTFIGDFHE